MPAPTSLAAALQSYADARPEEPWLFYAEGWDWRWLSWGEAARRLREEEIPSGPAEAVIRSLRASRADSLTAAARIQDEISLPPRPGAREILVLSGPFDDPAEQAMLAWAVVSGAALVIEPDPALRVATAAWVRPTLFHGTATELARLRQVAGKDTGRRFWRLRTLLWTGADLPREEAESWAGRGVKLARFPELFPPPGIVVTDAPSSMG